MKEGDPLIPVDSDTGSTPLNLDFERGADGTWRAPGPVDPFLPGVTWTNARQIQQRPGLIAAKIKSALFLKRTRDAEGGMSFIAAYGVPPVAVEKAPPDVVVYREDETPEPTLTDIGPIAGITPPDDRPFAERRYELLNTVESLLQRIEHQSAMTQRTSEDLTPIDDNRVLIEVRALRDEIRTFNNGRYGIYDPKVLEYSLQGYRERYQELNSLLNEPSSP